MRLGLLVLWGVALIAQGAPYYVDSIDLAIERNLIRAVDRSGIAANSYHANPLAVAPIPCF